MHKTLIPGLALVIFSCAGSALAQDAAAPAGGNTASEQQTMTCADLNEMEEAEALAFLRGYEFAMSSSGQSDNANSAPNQGTATSGSQTAAAGVGNAVTTGDVAQPGPGSSLGGSSEGSPFDASAILASCFDAPETTMEELLSGSFGVAN